MADNVKRHSYLGGSDSAKIMGEHTFGSAKDVFEKIHPEINVPSEDLSENPDIRRGNICEPYALSQIEGEYPTLNGSDVREEFDEGGGIDGQIFLQHEKHNFVAGHPDGLSVDPFDGEVIVHEVKAPRSGGIKRIRKRGIPSRYFFQVQHYMGIADTISEKTPRAIVWPFDCDKWSAEPIEVTFRPDLFETMCSRYRKMWDGAVKQRLSWDEMDWPTDSYDPDVYESPEMSEMLARYYNVRKRWKESEDEMRTLKSKILSELAGEDRIEGNEHYATVKEYKNSTHLTVREK